MAKGGIITKPTKILAGEAGAEAIIPLSRNSLIDINPIVVAINELGKSQEKLISSINNKPIMIEACQHTLEEYGLVIAKSNIINVTTSEIKIPVSNFTSSTVKVPAETCFAQIDVKESCELSSLKQRT